MKPFGNPDPAGMNADQSRVGPDHGPHLRSERLKQLFGVW
jgi:hypothetical protein